MNLLRTSTFPLVAIIVATALARVVPHWPNFTPVMAVALMGGALFANRLWSIIVPLAAMVLSDIAMGVVFGPEYALHGTQLWVYGSVVAISLFGHAVRSWRPASLVIGGGTIAAVAFFLVTNFAVWLSGTMYPSTLEGLAACYTAGLAFYRDSGNFLLNGIVSTWLYAATIALAPLFVQKLQLSTK